MKFLLVSRAAIALIVAGSVGTCTAAAPGNGGGKKTAAASIVKQWDIMPTSLVTRDRPALQRIDLAIECREACRECVLHVRSGGRLLAEKPLGTLRPGANQVSTLLAERDKAIETCWTLSEDSRTLAEKNITWNPVRHWTLHVIKSAHVDIGLHDPQYKQRLLSVESIDRARQLADQTAGWPDASRYRYVIEGLWWWRNYPQDRSEEAVKEVIKKYVRPGVFDIGASHSGNHTQVYGTEELCRSAYYAQEARDRWKVAADTMLMVDNNGITWPLVTAYADAGIRNLVFLPNAWNPKTVGGSRIDVGWDSPLPHVFYWQGPDGKSRLLVWANPHYTTAGVAFGLKERSPEAAAGKMAAQLRLLESRYPYDVWLTSFYWDNEVPSDAFARFAKAWNEQWRWPELRTVGRLSEPFQEVEKRFGGRIPTLRGDITGGWAQHPLSTPILLAQKREADRLLPTAEKLATLAQLVDPQFVYPTLAFRRAWDALIANDEHGYGTSHYKGRPVYDTWMQKRDWIERAGATAKEEAARGLKALAAQVPAQGPTVFVFNPTLQARAETVEVDLPESCQGLETIRLSDGTAAAAVKRGSRLAFQAPAIAPLGYAVFPLTPGAASRATRRDSPRPPTVENDFYRLVFAEDGSIRGIFDKQLHRELLDPSAPHHCNQLVYTRDAHKSFSSPGKASFEIETSPLAQVVIANIDDPASGAAIRQRVSLPAHEKRIDIDNRLDHVRDLAQKDRWSRFGYYAFPFAVPGGTFRVGLNGCIARPGEDQTGHGTEAYLPARDWAAVGNEQFGVALVQQDSHLVECGMIHADKQAFGQRPATGHLYSYLFNDWLYGHAHVIGPSHMNLRYRYTIYSHAGRFADAGVPRLAERVVAPVLSVVIAQEQKGSLPAGSCSFLSVDAPNVELLTLKQSEKPGGGVIARFHETEGRSVGSQVVRATWTSHPWATACSITEQDREALVRPAVSLAPFGYATLRFRGESRFGTSGAPEKRQIATAQAAVKADKPSAPAKVGIVYTGLISAPRAWRGDTPDLLYLQWGQNREPNLSHYELFRSRSPDCPASDKTLVAEVPPGPYVVVPFTDQGLKPHTKYYYRVRAVDRDGRKGPPSEVCVGITREQ